MRTPAGWTGGGGSGSPRNENGPASARDPQPSAPQCQPTSGRSGDRRCLHARVPLLARSFAQRRAAQSDGKRDQPCAVPLPGGATWPVSGSFACTPTSCILAAVARAACAACGVRSARTNFWQNDVSGFPSRAALHATARQRDVGRRQRPRTHCSRDTKGRRTRVRTRAPITRETSGEHHVPTVNTRCSMHTIYVPLRVP